MKPLCFQILTKTVYKDFINTFKKDYAQNTTSYIKVTQHYIIIKRIFERKASSSGNGRKAAEKAMLVTVFTFQFGTARIILSLTAPIKHNTPI